MLCLKIAGVHVRMKVTTRLNKLRNKNIELYIELRGIRRQLIKILDELNKYEKKPRY